MKVISCTLLVVGGVAFRYTPIAAMLLHGIAIVAVSEHCTHVGSAEPWLAGIVGEGANFEGLEIENGRR
ncbi:hypothetical protein [Accumulibacter sp.]|uniref:hypothetical protein n=1 Tax=Accumulibacter sp. TaxID=2053492 RepID=UPI0032C23CFD